jgi:hypothetical protein
VSLRNSGKQSSKWKGGKKERQQKSKKKARLPNQIHVAQDNIGSVHMIEFSHQEQLQKSTVIAVTIPIDELKVALNKKGK